GRCRGRRTGRRQPGESPCAFLLSGPARGEAALPPGRPAAAIIAAVPAAATPESAMLTARHGENVAMNRSRVREWVRILFWAVGALLAAWFVHEMGWRAGRQANYARLLLWHLLRLLIVLVAWTVVVVSFDPTSEQRWATKGSRVTALGWLGGLFVV